METVTPGLMQGIFTKQEELMKEYVKMGKLSAFPVSLDTKPGQKDVRDTIACIIQELSEAYDEAEDVYINVSENNQGEAEIHHTYFHVELADTLHFFIELLIQSGIGYEDMIPYLVYKQVIPNDKPTTDVLAILIKNANVQNQQSIINEVSKKDCFVVPSASTVKYTALTYINIELLGQFSSFNWGIVNALMKAQNKLRAQAWRDTVYTVDIRAYHTHIMEAFEYLIRLYEWLGLNEYSMSYIYQEKNKVNFERLKEGY